MLNPERNADDRDDIEHAAEHMRECKPPTGEHQPDDIAGNPEWARAEILRAVQISPAHRLATEWPEGESADHETGPAPGNADDGHEGEQAHEPPEQPHPHAAEHEPQNVADKPQNRHDHPLLIRPLNSTTF